MNRFCAIKLLLPYVLTVVLFFQHGTVESQNKSADQVVLDAYQGSKVLSLSFERDKIHGSPYLVPGWLNGVVELADHKKISGKDEKFLFNYDKLNVRLYVLDTGKKIWFYPVDSVTSFEFQDSFTSYEFQKIHYISKRFFLIPVIQSDKGYSLYKRLITEFRPSNYINMGYNKEGRNYDEYLDFYEYYLIFPGSRKFKKFYLKEKSVIRALKNESQLVKAYFEINSMEFNEQSILGLVQYINEKKFPD